MRYSKSLLISLASITLLLFNTACKEKKVEETVVRPVVYHQVSLSTGVRKRTFSGAAETDKMINLSFRNQGIITLFNIRIGQRVKKGELLAKLDNVESRLAYERSITEQNSMESEMKTAKLNYDRVRSLYEKGSSSLSDFENAKNSYQNAVNGFESAKRSVEIQKEQINYGFIYAPENGVISAVEAEIEENVSPGQMVAVLNAGDQMTIGLGIPESVINDVKESMEVTINFPSIRGLSYNGIVTEVSPAVDPNTATYPIKVNLTDADDQVKSGMAANVTFNFAALVTESLIIPAASVGEDSKGQYVFLIEKSANKNVVTKQTIEVGELTSSGFVINQGLAEGQLIAAAGLQTLLDGQEVRLQESDK